jgi:hypothetical protein
VALDQMDIERRPKSVEQSGAVVHRVRRGNWLEVVFLPSHTSYIAFIYHEYEQCPASTTD